MDPFKTYTRSHIMLPQRDAENHETFEHNFDEIVAAAEAPKICYDQLIYENCTRGELYRFVSNRTDEAIPKFSTKEDLVAILEYLDQNVTFSFLDLYPELRNLIYEELLCHDRKIKSKAYPQILRASKQTYREGKGIFADLSTARFTVTFRHSVDAHAPGQPVASRLFSVGDMSYTWSDVADEPNLPGLPTSLYLAPFRRIQNLTLKITILNRCDEDWKLPQEFFRQLVEVCKDLRKVDVEIVRFEAGEEDEEKELLRYLESLIDLSSEATLRLRGLTPNEEAMFWQRAAEETARLEFEERVKAEGSREIAAVVNSKNSADSVSEDESDMESLTSAEDGADLMSEASSDTASVGGPEDLEEGVEDEKDLTAESGSDSESTTSIESDDSDSDIIVVRPPR